MNTIDQWFVVAMLVLFVAWVYLELVVPRCVRCGVIAVDEKGGTCTDCAEGGAAQP